MNKENTLSLTETETKMKRITYGGSEKHTRNQRYNPY